jgi:hypothetical protein
MRKQYLELITSSLVVGVFLLMAFGSGESDSKDNEETPKIDFNSATEVKNHIEGKWFLKNFDDKCVRLEISESRIKFNCILNENYEFQKEDEEEYSYTLTEAYGAEFKGQLQRFVSVSGDKSLGFRIFDPITILQTSSGEIYLCKGGGTSSPYTFEKVVPGSKNYW